MYSEFEQIFKSLFMQKYLGKIYGTSPDEDFSNRRIYLSEYRKILDKVAIGLRTLQQYELRAKDINKAATITLLALSKTLGCKIEDLLEK